VDLDGRVHGDEYEHAHRDPDPNVDGHADGFSDIDAHAYLVGYAHLEQYANA